MIAATTMHATAFLLSAALGMTLSGCKAKDRDSPAPPTVSSAEPDEFTGPCRELFDHVARMDLAPDAAVVDQIKARVGAKVMARRCQKGTMPKEEVACVIAAKSRTEIEACRPK